MKKILSLLMVAGLATTSFSQTLWTDNFETYTVGNLGSQGGWARDGGSNNMAKVANIDGEHGKSFQFASTAANSAGMWIYHDTNWTARNSENGIFVAEYDVYVGNNYAEVQVYDVDAGYYAIADIYMDPEYGAYFADQDDFDNETAGVLLTEDISANTWYKVKLTYDVMDTGNITITINDTEYGPFERMSGWFPTEIDVVANGTNNAGFDNFKVSAVKELLAVSDVSKSAKVSVYPNPVVDVLNITSDKKVAEVSIYDAAGKVVKTTAETAINVENLAKGVYTVSIKHVDGTKESKKIIKK